MRRVSLSAAAALLVFLAPAWSRQDQQQSQSSQTQQQSSASQGQNQSKTQAPATPQESLAEAARKAREQKREAPKAAKVFTNDNIPTAGGISSVGAQAEAAPAGGETGATGTGQGAANTENPAGAAAPSAEKTWRERFAKLHHKLDQDQADLDVMQRELGVLNTQYYSDPMKTLQQSVSREDINKKTAGIEAKKKQIEDDKKAIADAQDELRKSGGDPGWASQ
jgi:DNA repair exonuclease SbcCD ATPase subunit